MDNTIIVIGNGFDLDLGLKTSYKDFINEVYLNQDESKREQTNQLIDAILAKYKDAGWIDIEAFLRDYALEYNQKPIEDRRNIQSEYNKLCSDLNSYMYADKYPSTTGEIYNTNSSAFKLLSFATEYETPILSLNYTDLSPIVDMIDIPGNYPLTNITYVHGLCVGKYTGRNIPIILGIDSISVRDEFKCMIKSAHESYNSGIISALDFAKNIIFFGVGFGITDAPYFKSFFNKVLSEKTENVRIFVFTKGDGTNFYYRVSQMIGGENLPAFREKDIHIYDTTQKDVYNNFIKDFKNE